MSEMQAFYERLTHNVKPEEPEKDLAAICQLDLSTMQTLSSILAWMPW